MVKAQKISSVQLISLLLLSRIYGIFSYSPSANKSIDGSVMLLSLLISFGMTYLLILPAYFLLRKHPGNCLIQSCMDISPVMGKIIAFLMGITFLYVACEAVGQFEYFMTTAVFPGKGTMVFFILLALTACYFVYMGIEPISRVSSILVVIILVALGILALELSKEIHLVNICSPLISGWKAVFFGAFFSLFHNLELVALLMMIPFTNGDMEKIFLKYNLWALGIFELVDFLVVTVLSSYARTRTLPIFTLSSATTFFFVQSLDAVYNCLWSFIALIRTSLYLFLAVRAFHLCFDTQIKKAALPLCTLLLLAGGFVLSQWLQLFNFTYSLIASGFFVFIVLLVIPTLIQIVDWFLKKKRQKGVRS